MLRGPVWLRSTMAGQIPTLASTTRARGMREYTPRPFIRPWIELSARETPAAAYRDTSYYRKANRNRQSTKRRKHILLATRFQIQQCRQKPPSGLTINLPFRVVLAGLSWSEKNLGQG
ncbi:uncharacterized protein H6S33_005193 [Morchella sextelata]|uniref:uncharacterized protein n=1 Tax=Morchella sextelata TaxID=1174677 RepID=UPI001D048A0A|nr:uncharacterized protein H6S33_005193 [Morchella sextelata]KAH0605211.1 hypothetical protein H6S33_005193 [Morchella sextelata]